MLDIRLENRTPFVVWGYSVETNLENNDQDVGKLYADHKKELETLPGNQPGLFGVMWYTDEKHKRYFYMLATRFDDPGKVPAGIGMQSVEIPGGKFAVASLPEGTDLGEAWTDFYFKELPARGLETNHQHGLFFEWYPVEGEVELWNPVKQI